MGVPTFDKFMLPLLQLLGDKQEHRSKDIIEQLADYFNLNDEERSELLPSGRQTRLVNRISWAKIYLAKAGLVENTGRGISLITPIGIGVLKQNVTHIDRDFLLQFPDFAAFQSRSANTLRPENSGVPDETQTPEDMMERAYQTSRGGLAEKLLGYVLSLSDRFFEQLVVDLLLKMGYGGHAKSGQRIGQSGDGGIDGYIEEDKLGLDIIYIQAKKWARNRSVGSPEIRNFAGSLEEIGAKKGVFFTTSYFSQPALDTIKKLRNHKIVLINGDELAQLMIDYDIGVRAEATYVIKKLDEGYFSEQ